ncbi:MAG: stage 0 sporulation family protein [Firmicutes bacterium]|nr:stage 0 sporulation family protein [Bacillota bacterium]
MQTVVGVRFKKVGKIYYFDPGDLDPHIGDSVIVETARGLEFGEVVVEPKQVDEQEIVQPLRKVIRIAGPDDLTKLRENKLKEKRAFDLCLQKILIHGLPMKLVDVECAFDNSKMTFYFTAEGRVDFRELVKDLAATFKTRIELRQIGVRDEAKMVGGLGPCGRPLCCASFLGDFEPVSIRMAKEQDLPLNPMKISGICGRLMCCLKYESGVYRELRQNLPQVGSEVQTKEGKGKVVGINILRQKVKVQLFEDERTVEFNANEVIRKGPNRAFETNSRQVQAAGPGVPAKAGGAESPGEEDTEVGNVGDDEGLAPIADGEDIDSSGDSGRAEGIETGNGQPEGENRVGSDE